MRDAERAKMRAEIMARQKAAAKKMPSFEVMEPTDEEKKRGEAVAAYQAKKAAETQEREDREAA